MQKYWTKKFTIEMFMQKTIHDILFSFHNKLDIDLSIFFWHIEIQYNQHYFFTVSGGVDSMVMATLGVYYLLWRWTPVTNMHILHYNHSQRKESKQEEASILAYFRWYDIVMWTYIWWTNQTENTLRKARWEFFESSIQQYPWAYLFLWHHLQDKIETVMMNMKRGCGVRGLFSMPYQQNISKYDGREYSVIRPCVNTKKENLYRIANKYVIPYREDTSNQKVTISQRNVLRKEYCLDIGIFPLFVWETWLKELSILPFLEKVSIPDFLYCFRIHREYYMIPDHIRELLDFCDIYTNCSENRLKEIEKICFSTKGWYMYLAGRYLRKQGKHLYCIASKRHTKNEIHDMRHVIKKMSNLL